MNKILKYSFSIFLLMFLIVQDGFCQVHLPRLMSDGMILKRAKGCSVCLGRQSGRRKFIQQRRIASFAF